MFAGFGLLVVCALLRVVPPRGYLTSELLHWYVVWAVPLALARALQQPLLGITVDTWLVNHRARTVVERQSWLVEGRLGLLLGCVPGCSGNLWHEADHTPSRL